MASIVSAAKTLEAMTDSRRTKNTLMTMLSRMILGKTWGTMLMRALSSLGFQKTSGMSRLMDQAAMTINDESGTPLSHLRILYEGGGGDETGHEDEEMGDIQGLNMEIEETIGRKARKRKRKAIKPTSKVSLLMGKVNVAYARKEYSEAFRLLHEVIQIDYKAADAWRLLAVVHDELGDPVKALQANFLAAHLTPKDWELWGRLGQISRKLNHATDAIYCYSKAVSANPKDLNSWFDLSYIYAEQNRYQKAIDGYSTILRHMPLNMQVIKELSRIFMILKDVSRAISLFEAALQADAKSPLPPEEANEDEEVVGMVGGMSMSNVAPKKNLRIGYDELHMLVELYFEIKEYEKAFDAIKVVLSRIFSIDVETFDEFLDGFELIPVEIRAQLGICRLWLDDVERAKSNFEYLFREPIDDYTEQYFEVADAFSGKRMLSSSLEVLDRLWKNESTNTPRTWKKIAHAFLQIGNLESAAELFTAVVEEDPDDDDTKLHLAEIYTALKEHEMAEKLINEVNEQSASKASKATELEVSSTSLTREIRGKQIIRSKGDSQDKAIRAAEEAVKARENKALYAKLKMLSPKLDDHLKRVDFLRTARQLVSRFQETKAFYPIDKNKPFTGMFRKRVVTIAGADGSGSLESVEFQGMSLEEWYSAFCEYARALSLDGKEEDAFLILKSASDANVFYQDKTKMKGLRLQMLASAVYCGNLGRAVEHIRSLFQEVPDSIEPYRIYSALLAGGGDEGTNVFSSTITQKYFLRIIKGMDTAYDKDPDPSHQNPVLWFIYGHLCMCTGSYVSAIPFFVRAYNLLPDEPIVNMSLGLAYLHYAMQRRTDKRQLRIVQGFTFLFRYFEIEKGSMEACYNLARAFHQIGVMDHAIEYYEKVLEGPDDGPSVWLLNEDSC
ncbi:transcription factor TFIIIC subunit tfc4 [Dinochytrium kinnereticum]|nr:transcription factor TFIIIC subunit tfc4 [Dinochytrium kinnereticum]